MRISGNFLVSYIMNYSSTLYIPVMYLVSQKLCMVYTANRYGKCFNEKIFYQIF